MDLVTSTYEYLIFLGMIPEEKIKEKTVEKIIENDYRYLRCSRMIPTATLVLKLLMSVSIGI